MNVNRKIRKNNEKMDFLTFKKIKSFVNIRNCVINFLENI